jgi:LacI family transcriptional regulator
MSGPVGGNEGRRGEVRAGDVARPSGIREVAESAGVSIGTVDRALHDRPGVSSQTRKRVLEAARALGYQPNLAARVLRSRKHLLRIAVAFPAHGVAFSEAVLDGVLEAAHPLQASGVSVQSYGHRPESDVDAFQAALADEAHGLIVTVGGSTLSAFLDRAARRRIPVACVGDDPVAVGRCLVNVDADRAMSGAMAAELAGRFARGRGRVLVVTAAVEPAVRGSEASTEGPEIESFRRTLTEMWPGMEVAALVAAHDRPTADYEAALAALERSPDLVAIYVNTINPVPVLQAIDDRGFAGKAAIITTGLSATLARYIASGKVTATIDLRHRDQGQAAFQALHRHLTEGFLPQPTVRLAPQVVMRSNLEALRAQLNRGQAADGDGPSTVPSRDGS